MAHSGLTVAEADRTRLVQEALRFGTQSLESVAEPYASRNFMRLRAIMNSTGTALSPETAKAAEQAIRASHLRMSHIDHMDPTPVPTHVNRFTGRSLESGADSVVAADTHARLTAAMWAGDKKMVKLLDDNSDLRTQAQQSSFADINVMPVDPAFQLTGRLDRIRAQAQSEAMYMQPLLKAMDHLPLQYVGDDLDNAPANMVVWEKSVLGARALEGRYEDLDEDGFGDDADRRVRARRLAMRAPADPMDLPRGGGPPPAEEP